MRVESWEAEAEKGSEGSFRDGSYSIGEWPVLIIRLTGRMSCPSCHHSFDFQTTSIKVLPAAWDLDRFETNRGVMTSWVTGQRECPECGLSSTVPENYRGELKDLIRAKLSRDWLRQQFNAFGLVEMPRDCRRYNHQKALTS